ncbi:MAG TPA: hypothetical protein VF755_17145, partial [Catenuloplanes sp.]
LTAEELLDDAELAMGWAKRHKSANVVLYHEHAGENPTGRAVNPWTTLGPNAPFNGQLPPH